jgi:hypothetical protein
MTNSTRETHYYLPTAGNDSSIASTSDRTKGVSGMTLPDGYWILHVLLLRKYELSLVVIAARGISYFRMVKCAILHL